MNHIAKNLILCKQIQDFRQEAYECLSSEFLAYQDKGYKVFKNSAHNKLLRSAEFF